MVFLWKSVNFGANFATEYKLEETIGRSMEMKRKG
jgi:hypothetical protein